MRAEDTEDTVSQKIDIKLLGLLSLYGLSLVWSPMFGTSEGTVFVGLAAHPDAMLLSRVFNLAAFGAMMAALSVLGEQARSIAHERAFIVAACALGTVGMAIGALVGLGALPLTWLFVGATLRGLFYGAIVVSWVGVLIHLDNDRIGLAVSAALALYAVAGIVVSLLALTAGALATLCLCACPIASCFGCVLAASSIGAQAPVGQETAKAPLRTRMALYAANFLFGIMLGALLYYFALYDTLTSVLAFLVVSAGLLAAFAVTSKQLTVSTAFRGFILGFAVVVALALLTGYLNQVVATLIAAGVLAFVILFTIIIFTDTQARFRKPYWKVPGMCQVFASLGMIGASVTFQTVFPNGGISAEQLVLLSALCMVFVAGVFSPSDRTRVRPWGFSSLIPAETPEARMQRRCEELAGECGLTARELEILKLLATGATKDQIATALVISPTTAKTHTRNIYAKLGVHSHKELVDKMDA